MINTFKRGSNGALPPLPVNSAVFLSLDRMLSDGGPRLVGLLLALRGRLHGALAIVTMHRLSTVDRLLTPVLLAGAGCCGAELRLRFNQPVQSASGALPQAMDALMAQTPFSNRVPVFVGDDDTDPAVLFAAEELGGLGVRLCARERRLPDLIAHYWLRNGVAAPRKSRPLKNRIAPALLAAPPRQFPRPLSA